MSQNKRAFQVHPTYEAMLSVWTLCRDCNAGSETIKSKRSTYLPPTSGMVIDGYGSSDQTTVGNQAYKSYITRAYYPDIYKEAVETAVGIMHRKPANIKLSPKLEILKDYASDAGETLQLLLRRINAEQLTSGRLGLMGDIRTNEENKEVPILLLYEERNGYNWDDRTSGRSDASLRMVALDEGSFSLEGGMNWVWKDKTRVLALIDPVTRLIAQQGEDGSLPSNSIYGYAEFSDEVQGEALLTTQFTPVSVKGETFKEIAFTFINSRDLLSKPDVPPLEGLADLSLLIYRGEADYRQNLFMQGQDTLVVINGVSDEDEKATRTGAGARLDVGINGDAKYIGVNSQGLPEQRQALEADYKRGERKTSKLMSGTNTQESGDALRIRAASQTATLPQIAMAGAAGLQYVLRRLAVMLGDNPEDVVVMPNMEFSDQGGDAVSLKAIMEAKLLGAPISIESIHAWSKRSGFTEETWEDELKKLEEDSDYEINFSLNDDNAAGASNNVGTNIDIDNSENQDGDS